MRRILWPARLVLGGIRRANLSTTTTTTTTAAAAAPPPPFEIAYPDRNVARQPILFDSPHSGRYYPAEWKTASSGAALRAGEDAYVDQLVSFAPRKGVALLHAMYPRCYIDVNRAADDLDLELLREPWPSAVAPSDKSRKGLGLIRRFVTPGVEVNAERLSVADVQRRLDEVYWPYHSALRALQLHLVSEFGFAFHIDWHSMKSVGNAMTPDGAGARRSDFVVSDLDGASAEPQLTSLIVEQLRSSGFSVSVNEPYKGGTIVQRYGRHPARLSVVQIEINRALYLDEATVTLKQQEFQHLSAALEDLTDACILLARSKPKTTTTSTTTTTTSSSSPSHRGSSVS